MKKVIRILLIILFFTSCGEDGSIGLIEYGNLTGKVVQKEGFVPLENVKITLSPTNNTVFTDVEGNFSFDEIEAQEYAILATMDGYLDEYEGTTITVDGTVNVVLEMEISTALNKAPTKPELLSPEDGAIDLLNEVELTWESSDPEEDALTYTLEIRNDFSNDVTRITDLVEKSYTLSDCKYGAKYFWSIEVTDNINAEVISSLRSFTVKADPENRYLYVKNVDGNNVIYSSSFSDSDNEVSNTVQVTDSNLNSWRPRKSNITNLIAFLRIDDNEAHIFTMKTNGEDVKKVTSSVPVAGFNLNEIDFSWSADGSKILYPYFDKLYSINIDGSGLQKVFQTKDGSLITECDWSSDGSKIAIKTNNEIGYSGSILVINLGGTVLDVVITGVKGALGGLNFSASGNKLLFSRDVSDYQTASYRQLDTRMFIYNFTDKTFFDISLDEKESGTNDLDARFSPNEAFVIFVNTSNDGISEKYVSITNLSGNIKRTLLFSNATMPDWE